MNVSSPYFEVACVLTGATAVFGLGLMFVRASRIERRNLVAGFTLATSFVAMAILWNSSVDKRTGQAEVASSAIALDVFGFLAGWVLDRILGGRRRVHRDEATLGADLAD